MNTEKIVQSQQENKVKTLFCSSLAPVLADKTSVSSMPALEKGIKYTRSIHVLCRIDDVMQRTQTSISN